MQSQNDITVAFGPLLGRAILEGHGADRLSLADYVTEAEIGAFQQERGVRQRMRFSVVVELGAPGAGAGDDVDGILSYDRLHEAIDAELAGGRLNLLETLAEGIAARILAEPQASRVFLRIEKLDRGPWTLGVEIVRARAQGVEPAPPAARPRPVVAWFTGAVPDLRRRLSRLEAQEAPVVICLGPPDMPRPKSADPAAQMKIDLLAIEQAAWALAARDPRLSVVSSRTEIDWSLRQGAMIVWAPSKLVLDSPGAPAAAGDGFGLAAWLADLLDATQIVVHGKVAEAAESRVPVTTL